MSYFKVLFTIWLYFVSSDIFDTLNFHCILKRLLTAFKIFQTKRNDTYIYLTAIFQTKRNDTYIYLTAMKLHN